MTPRPVQVAISGMAAGNARPGGEPRRARRSRRQLGAGAALLILSALLALRALGLWPGDAIVWPIVAAVAGALLIWQQSTRPPRAAAEAPIAALRQAPETAVPAAVEPVSGRPSAAYSRELTGAPVRARAPALGGSARGRIAIGASLVIGAGLLFLWANGALSRVGNAVLPIIVVLVGLVLILTPLWWRMIRSLDAERTGRAQSQERTALAAHLHDSVLQTLAMIQRRAEDPHEVAALARRQERELRDWLSEPVPTPPGASFGRELKDVAAAVEEAHGATVEVVVVGERPLDEAGEAAVAAAREAILNAAKFGEGSPISVYAELSAARIEIFVRDRGPGFDPAQVPSDRRGLRDSIVGRVERYGGRAIVRSTPGQGTEVELSLRRGEGG